MSSIFSTIRTSIWPITSKVKFLLLAMLGVVLLSLPLFSQGSNGRILGTVTDQSGGVISNATVTITDKDRGVARTLTTDDAGEYNAPNLIPGTYIVSAEANGFRKLERQNVVLEVGKEIRVDLTLQPGAQAQTVTVTEAIPLVETANATLGGTLENAQIQDLPLNGRDYQNLMALRPGVMLQPGGGPWTQSTNNIRPDESVWMLDGVINTSFYDATPIAGRSSPTTDAAAILPLDAIQEFNLEENPKAEFGWRPGAVVNVGIKSGTNTLHGTAFAFGRDDSFNARNYFNVPASGGTCLPNPALLAACDKLPQQLEQFGGTVGGPIEKDKLFFFAGYEALRSSIGNAFSTTAPATASGLGPKYSMVDAIRALPAGVPSPVSLALLGCPSGPLTASSTCTGGLIQNDSPSTVTYFSTFPNTNTSDSGIAKLDYHINSKNQLTGTLFVGNYTGFGEDHPQLSEAFINFMPIRVWSNVENWIWTPNSRWVNEARFGYNRDSFGFNLNPVDANRRADGSGLTGGSGYPINTGVTAIGGLPDICISGFNCIGDQRGRPFETAPDPYFDIQDDISYLHGKHSFKFGGEYAHIEANWASQDRGQILFFAGAGPYATPLENFFAGAPTQARIVTGGAPTRTEHESETAGFFQDDWRITQRLTINLGLRYSYQTPFTDSNGGLGNFEPGVGLVQQGIGGVNTIFNPDYKNFSPRLGFAWDVTGKGTTVVRGGVSIIYSTFTVANFFSQPGQQNDAPTTSIATTPTGACSVPVPIGQTCAQQPGGSTLVPGGTIANANKTIPGSALNWNGTVFPVGVVPSCTSGNPCNILAVTPNLKLPYLTNWTIDVQHAITNNLSLEVGYVGNHGSRLTGFRNLNQAPLGAGYCLNAPLTTAQSFGDCAGGPIPVSAGADGVAEQQARPYYAQFPYLGVINQMSNLAISNYNSLQTTLTQRTSHGLSFVAGYTYAHGLDDGSLNRFGLLPQNSSDVRAEYAASDFDIRHRFTLTTSYDIPGKKGFAQMLEGWKVNAIVNLQSAQPWSLNDFAFDFSGTGDTADRWNFFGNPADFKEGPSSIPFCGGFGVTGSGAIDTSGVSCTQVSQLSGQTVQLPASLANACVKNAPDPNTLAAGGCYVAGNSVMAPPGVGKFGTMGRNTFRDNGYKDVDFSIFKNFTFKERVNAQFRVEVFNIFNWPTVANPWGSSNGYATGIDPSSPNNFGCGCNTPDFAAGSPIVSSGDNRVMQLGLKLTF